MSKTVIVIPNHLPHLDFLNDWHELRNPDVEIIVIQDIGTKPKLPKHFTNITIYDHDDIKADLGENDWIIPTKSSACRSYGYYKAWQRHPEYIITLDNDCYPEKEIPAYYVRSHLQALNTPATLDWVNTATDLPMRGHPYLIRGKSEVWLNHGLWSNVPDLDAPTWLHHLDLRFDPTYHTEVIPRYNFFPMCGMNLAWRRDLTPALYFGLFGPDYGFDQFDDIWAGVLVKKVMDHLGHAVRSGFPSVEHRKQSNVFVNLNKQAPGMAMNEHFWRVVQQTHLNPVDPREPKATQILLAYEQLITQLPDVITDEPEGYTKKFKEAALLWIGLFKNAS